MYCNDTSLQYRYPCLQHMSARQKWRPLFVFEINIVLFLNLQLLVNDSKWLIWTIICNWNSQTLVQKANSHPQFIKNLIIINCLRKISRIGRKCTLIVPAWLLSALARCALSSRDHARRSPYACLTRHGANNIKLCWWRVNNADAHQLSVRSTKKPYNHHRQNFPRRARQ